MQKAGLDVSILMKSKEVREYYASDQIWLSFEQQEKVIVSCYLPIREKVKWLKVLSDSCSGEEQQRATEMLLLFEAVIELYDNPEKWYPGNRFFYVIERVDYQSEMRENADADKFTDTYAKEVICFDSIEDAESYMNSYLEPENKLYLGKTENEEYLFYVKLMVLQEKGKHIEPVEFLLISIDGRYTPCYFDLDMDLEERKKWKEAIERYEDLNMRFEMPFEHGSRVKIQLPGMKHTYFGVMSSELDGNGCRYRFLYEDGTDVDENWYHAFTNLSYSTIGNTSF